MLKNVKKLQFFKNFLKFFIIYDILNKTNQFYLV